MNGDIWNGRTDLTGGLCAIRMERANRPDRGTLRVRENHRTDVTRILFLNFSKNNLITCMFFFR